VNKIYCTKLTNLFFYGHNSKVKYLGIAFIQNFVQNLYKLFRHLRWSKPKIAMLLQQVSYFAIFKYLVIRELFIWLHFLYNYMEFNNKLFNNILLFIIFSSLENCIIFFVLIGKYFSLYKKHEMHLKLYDQLILV